MNAASAESAYLADIAARVERSWPPGLPREPHYPFGRVPITEYVRGWARERPTDTAIIFYGREVTYAELDRWSDGIAAWLAGKGVARGDRVAIYLPSCPQYTVAFLGILKAGAIVVPISSMAREMEVSHFLLDSGAKLVVAQDSLVATLRGALDRSAVEALLVTAISDFLPAVPTLPVPNGLDAPPLHLDDVHAFSAAIETTPLLVIPIRWDDFAVLNYTGGTTGVPKGCIHAHGDLVYTGATAATFCSPSDGPRILLNFMPMFWIGGECTGVLIPLVSRSKLVLLTRWDAAAVMAAIDRYQVTTTWLMVDGAVEIMEHPECPRYNLMSLRHSHAVSFIKVLNREYRASWKALTGSILRESAWGMTETNTFDTFTTGFQDDDFDLSGPPTFVGLPMPGTQFKIVDPQTGSLVKLGQEGELCVRTPSLLKGYWSQRASTSEGLRDGWLRTGDVAVISDKGLLTFRGRRREMLKVNGVSVFPAEVEALLMRHPSIAACGVTGRSDPAKGQVPVAFVRLAPDVAETRESLDGWCRANIAVYKVPEIRIVTDLPMTPTGKVKRAELQALI